MRFQIRKAPSVKMNIFCDVALCSLVRIHQRFRSAYCFLYQGDVSHLYIETSVIVR
jgi:hypothetical protein